MSDDGDFRSGRFRPVAALVGLLLVAGAGAAVYYGLRVEASKMSADQIAALRKDVYSLDRDEQAARFRTLAESGPIALRQEAIAQLALLEDKEVVPISIRALSSVDHRARGAAAQALATVGLPLAEPARAPLIKALGEADLSDRPQIAWALVILGEKSVFPRVMEIYRAGHLASVERLGGGRAFDLEALSRMASPDEWEKLAGDESDSVRQLVAGILSRNAEKKYTATLIKLVNDPKPDVARDAASGLGRIGDAAATTPLVNALARADKDAREGFLTALRDGMGGAGLVLALPSVAKEPRERTKFQTKQIFDMVRTLADPRAGDALVAYLGTKPPVHWMTEAALRLAEIGDLRAIPFLAERLRLDPQKIYDDKLDPEYRRDDGERVVSARMLADLAVLHPDEPSTVWAPAEDAALFWCRSRPAPHANGLRFLAAIRSRKVLSPLRDWADPDEALPKEGASGSFPREFETAPSALRYLGYARDKSGWSILEKQLFRKDPKLDITEQAIVGSGISMVAMVLRGLSVGAAEGFSQWGDSRATPLLLKLIEDPKQHEEARIASCRALAWVATSDEMTDVANRLTKLKANKDKPATFLRTCFLETLLRRPVGDLSSILLPLLNKETDVTERRSIARVLGWPGLDTATENTLLGKLSDRDLLNDAALALLIGGSVDAASRALASYGAVPREVLEDLKDAYFQSFGYFSDEDLSKGRLYHWVENAEAVARIRVGDSPQDWVRLRLSAEFDGLEFDNGPHSMTRVVLRHRLLDAARTGSTWTKKRAVQTLKFMREQGSLMALEGQKDEVGPLAHRALLELMSPKTVVGEKIPEARQGSESGRMR
jgi:HEAT repeat protein